MTKKEYLEFSKKHNFKISGKNLKSDVEYLIVINAKKNFNLKTSIDDIKFVLNILKINYAKDKEKSVLLKLLNEYKVDNEINIDALKDVKNLKKQKNEELEKIISVRDLRVSFRDLKSKKRIIEVIRGVSFDIYRGKITGFIGESGSGKSVTAKSLFGMNVNAITEAKTLNISGIDMVNKNENNFKIASKNKNWREIRGKKIAYIPQNPMTSLNPTMRVVEQILEVMNVSSLYENYSRSKKIDEIVELLENFGLENSRVKIKSFPHEFSGGMRQRIVVAMAVISRPDVIIADEPTTALDPTIQASVLSLFKSIATEYNIGIIFVSHDISVISTLCDFVNVFYAGRIVEKAPKYELFTNSKHPYTWALLSSMPESNDGKMELYTLDGSPPNFSNLPPGDPFSVRNKYAMEIDFKEEPPLFKVLDSDNHYAATWLLHSESPKVQRPIQVEKIAESVRKDFNDAGK
ncbi:MAG: ABC transporter ATP-binding protein [Mycoplasmatales bacterium]|nr:ABC transporter ATP-binding protein [Mycoplasmatales bacterium]